VGRQTRILQHARKVQLHLTAGPDPEERCKICFGDNYLMMRPVWIASMQGKSDSFVAYLCRVGLFIPSASLLGHGWLRVSRQNPLSIRVAAVALPYGICLVALPLSHVFVRDFLQLQDARSRTTDCSTGTKVRWMLCA